MIAAKLRHKDLVISSSDRLPFIACTAAPVISGHGNCNRRYKEKIARTGILISNGQTHKQNLFEGFHQKNLIFNFIEFLMHAISTRSSLKCLSKEVVNIIIQHHTIIKPGLRRSPILEGDLH